MQYSTTRWLLSLATVLLVATLSAGCGWPNDDVTSKTVSPEPESADLTTVSTPAEGLTEPILGGDLNGSDMEVWTYSPEYIEIDRLSGGLSVDFGDANLFDYPGDPSGCTPGHGADPADHTCDANLPASHFLACTDPLQTDACACTGDPLLDPPTCIVVEYLDWHDLMVNGGAPDLESMAIHRLLDDVKVDTSSFKNGSCVTTTNVLGKMDLTAGAISNNAEYSYLALKRYDNNGDAGYSWVFNKIKPVLDPDYGGCSEGLPLVYTLSQGDVLIVGNFNPSSGAELMVRRVSAAGDGLVLLAQNVVKLDAVTASGDPIWEPIPGSSNLATVNTTPTAAGLLELIDGTDQAGNRTDKGAVTGAAGSYAYGHHIFAEAAVDFRVFMGDGDMCEQRFYGSVITQPSSSKTSDLKDLLGPRLFNFGTMKVEATVEPTCEKALAYEVQHIVAPGIDTDDPDSIAGLICSWTFTHASGATRTASDCTGSLAFDPGDPTGEWEATLEVSIASGVSCSSAKTIGTVLVYEPMTATAGTAPTCEQAFTYESAVMGGSGDYTLRWEFSGPGTPTPSTSDQLSGTVFVDADGTWNAAFTATDKREDIVCSITAASSVVAAAPLVATPDLTATCDLAFHYDVDYSGGLNTPDIDWAFSGPGTPSPATSTSASGDVVVDLPGTWMGVVTLSEHRGDLLCTVTAHDVAAAYVPLTATLALSESCALEFGYAVTTTGGSGALTYELAFSGPGAVTPPNADNTSGTVGVSEPGSYLTNLRVVDQRADLHCEATDEESIEVYLPLAVVTADLTPTCDLVFGFNGGWVGGSPAATAWWNFSGPGAVDPPTTPVLVGEAGVGTGGTYLGVLSLTDVRTSGLVCAASASDTVDAWPLLRVAASAEPLCDSTFDYGAIPTGGSPAGVSYAWSFDGPGEVTAPTDVASGNAAVSIPDADYTATVHVTDLRADLACVASSAASAHPLAPITVSIAPNAAARACVEDDISCSMGGGNLSAPGVGNDGFDDALHYTATVGGGDGAYTFTWDGCTFADGPDCFVNPADDAFCTVQGVGVTVDDGSIICAAAPSEQETYTRITIITSTDN